MKKISWEINHFEEPPFVERIFLYLNNAIINKESIKSKVKNFTIMFKE